jgi:DNA-binding protein HU-beta
LDYNVKHRSTILRGGIMTKEELIEKVATGAKLTKADAARALDAAINAVKSALKKGQKVTLVGFGTFSVAKRKARQGRNPRTGETITIKAAKVPKFSAGKALKSAVK